MFKFLLKHNGKIFLTGTAFLIGGVSAIFMAPLAATVATVVTVTIAIAFAAGAVGGVYVCDTYHRQSDQADSEKRNNEKQEEELEKRKDATLAGENTDSAVKELKIDHPELLALKATVENILLEHEKLKKQVAGEQEINEDSTKRIEKRLYELSLSRTAILGNVTPNAVNDPRQLVENDETPQFARR